MGRCPLIIVLVVQIAIILLSDYVGWRTPQQPPAYGVNTYCGMILTTREASTSGQLLVVEIDSLGEKVVAPFKTRVHITDETPQVYAGQRIRFSGKLMPLPAVPQVPDMLDLHKNLRRQGVVASVTFPDDSIHYIAPSNRVREWFARANDATLTRLRQAPLQPQTVNVLAALLLGRSEELSADVRADYSSAGMAHVLALSGMHVGIIAMLIAVALWPFYFGRHIRTRLVLTIAALWFYAAFTGFIPSVTRSVIMATVYMLGRILQRKSLSLNSLCLAAIVILLFSPEDLYAVGFQLSFAAVLGIIIFYPLINRVNRREHPRRYALVSYPALTLGAMSLSGLVSAFHFHSFPVYFLLANMLIVPVVPMLIISGVMSLMFKANCGADAMCMVMNKIAGMFAGLPASTLTDLYPPAWVVITLILLLCLHGYAAHCKRRFLWMETALLFIGVMICRLVMPSTIYPAKEIYEVAEYRSTQTIVTVEDSCFVFTTAKLPADREEIEQRYRLLLRDFVRKRNIQEPKVK